MLILVFLLNYIFFICLFIDYKLILNKDKIIGMITEY